MTRMISRLLTGTVLSTALLAAPALAQDIGNASLPAVQLPAVQLPAVQLPAVQLPAVQLPAVQDGLPGADPLLDPDLALPADDPLFDENLVAGLPGSHGEVPPDQFENLSRSAVDEAMGVIPDRPGMFPGNETGPDLAGLDPSNPVNQPGGPNDPAWGGNEIPGLMNDPRNTGNGQGEGRRNPSNTLADPRDMASDGHHSVNYSNGGWSQQWSYTDSEGDNNTYTEEYSPDGEGGWTQTATHTHYGETWTTTQRSRKTIDADGNSTVVNDPPEYQRNHPVVIGPDDDDDDGGDPAGQPGIEGGGWGGGGIDVAGCGTTIPMWVCMRGGGGSATPDEMLAQPGEGETGSIMDGDSGPDLGMEAVTNTGGADWNTEDSAGHGDGGGGSGLDWQRYGDPDDSPDA